MTPTLKGTFGTRSSGGNGIGQHSLGKPPAAYPGRVATDSDLIIAVDRQQTTLLLGMAATDTTMTVLNASLIGAYNLLSIDSEIVKTTGAPAGNVIPIQRGFDGTSPATHSANATVSGLVDAYHHNALVAEIEAIEQRLGPNFTPITYILPPATATTLGGVKIGANIAVQPDGTISTSTLWLNAGTFNFPAQSPGGSLTVGNNVITLSPVPLGVNGTDLNHYLYISGGTGTAEAVKITGGTAVSGAPSGTVIVNCTYAHSGAWQISSASGGIQEAVDSVSGTTANVAIVIPAGDTYVYQTISLPIPGATGHFGNLSLIGLGVSVTQIRRGAGFVSGDIFFIDGSTYHGAVTIQGMDVLNDAFKVTSGASIHVHNQQTQTALLENLKIADGYVGIWLENVDFIAISNVDITFDVPYGAMPGTRPLAGFLLTGVSGNAATITNSNSWTVDTSANNVQYGMLVQGVDGLQVTNSGFNGSSGIKLDPSVKSVTNVYMNNIIIDSCTTKGIEFGAIGAGLVAGNVALSNMQIVSYPKSGGGFAGAAVGIDFEDVIGWNMVAISNFNIAGWQAAGIRFLTAGQSLGPIVISNGTICDIGLPAAHGFGISFQAGVCGVSVTGVYFGAVEQGAGQCMDYAFAGDSVANAQYFDWVIVGNNVRQHAGPSWLYYGPGNTAGFLLDSVIANNTGINTVQPSAASAATFRMPDYPNFSFTGTTGVTQVLTAMPPGFTWNFIPAAAVTFTAGPTIGNTFTATPGLPVLGYWDGNKLWLK